MKNKKKKMRSKGKVGFLIMALLSFSIHPLVHSREEKATGKDMINNKYDEGSGKAIAHQSHGAVGGGGSGGQPAASGGDSGGTHSPGGGGANAAGGGGNNNIHHNHHGGGNSSSRTGLATWVISIFACFLLCINKYW